MAQSAGTLRAMAWTGAERGRPGCSVGVALAPCKVPQSLNKLTTLMQMLLCNAILINEVNIDAIDN